MANSRRGSPLNFEKVHSFDFNLLLIFEVVFIHGSVKKAAKVIGHSAPAVSQALNKLREYLSDPLFVRDGQKIEPTTVAIKFHEHINKSFTDVVETVVNFASQNTTNRFVIYSSPYLALRTLPILCTALESRAIPCELVHLSADPLLFAGEDMLAYRKADIVLDTHPYYSSMIVAKRYMCDPLTAVCRKNHPRIKDVLTQEDMQAESSTFLNVKSEGLKRLQKEIDESYLHRNFSFTSSSVFVNPAISAATDSISFVPEWFADNFKEAMGLKKVACDIAIAPADYYVNYNKVSLKNNSFTQIIEVFEELYMPAKE